jgi:hypothetical protein
MLRFEIGADFFTGVIGQYALALERERSRTDFGDQIQFCRHERTVAGSAMIGQDMCGVEGCYLLQHSKPARRCAAVAEDVRHGLVLHYVARDQRAVRFDKGQLVAFGVGSAESEQAGRNTPKVDCRFLVENHVGPTQYNAREQVFILL